MEGRLPGISRTAAAGMSAGAFGYRTFSLVPVGIK